MRLAFITDPLQDLKLTWRVSLPRSRFLDVTQRSLRDIQKMAARETSDMSACSKFYYFW